MPSQILLLTQARSGSHLLERMLSKQSNVKLVSNHFSGGRWMQLQWLQSESYTDGMPKDALSYFEDEIRKGNEDWEHALSDARNNGQTLMLSQHVFFAVSPEVILKYIDCVNRKDSPSKGENFTMIPDSLLLVPNTVPVFTIQDPRQVVPSTYRTLNKMGIPHGGGRPNYLIVTCHIWHRVLYDYYVSHGIEPIVLHGDDYITSAEFVRYFCSKAGLDPDQAYLSWPTEGDPDKHHPMYYASQSTMLQSDAPDPKYAAKNRNWDEEEAKWETEFGEDLPLVKEMIDLALPHYNYLYEKRLKMDK